MIKAIIAALGLAVSVNAVAAPTTIVETMALQLSQTAMGEVHTQGLDWKVGDQNAYNIDMGFIKGTMIMLVRENGADGIWMDQNMDLGFAGKQNAQILLDKNTGEIKKMLVNGKEQQVPKQNVEVVEIKEDKITVPAGTFECVHARLKDKDKNEESNAWINPQQIPLSGMLKTVQPGQFGEVTVVLTSFKKN